MKKLTIFVMIILLTGTDDLVSQTPVRLLPFAEGLSEPTSLATDLSKRFFVTQRAGTIAIVDSTGNLNPVLFMDITDRVKSTSQEQGLLGIALHPQFLTNGYFYVNYTGNGDSTHISRFSTDPADPGKALPSSEYNLMTVYQPYQNHNGGDLHFGPDGYLYIGLGDGGSAGDPENRAQNKDVLLGKILRIDANSGNPYGIPPDNPFINDPLARHEIWALGLRNPWRFSFDRQTGDLWIADVGQGAREEIDFQSATSNGGENYGWRCYEGTLPYNTSGCMPQSDYVSPVYEYPHDPSPCWSVTGGYVSRGNVNSGMYGRYFFAEYCKDILWSLHDSAGVWVATTEGIYPGNNFSTFGEDHSGTLYIAGLASGKIFKIADSIISGINDIAEANKIIVFPVPCTTELTIKLPPGSGLTNLSLLDLSGRVIHTYICSTNQMTINVNGLSGGIYLLKAESQHFSVTGKIIRQ
ncbi:MAG TPA: PQQ-dependent sugar dehydrogenase [Bacteroidales bacterium]|nr:PQQ-dependent sugar dehydrogenase [Bacteroidales bacterium]